MKKILIFILINLSIFAVKLEDLRIEHSLILDEKGFYSGTISKDNMESNVELGVITSFTFLKDGQKIFEVEVNNNSFNGKGIMYHQKLGKLEILYDNGDIIGVEGKNFSEEWKDNIFYSGREKKGRYTLISKHPHIEFFDKYSYNVLQNYFEFVNVKKGKKTIGNITKLYMKNRLVKEYIYNEVDNKEVAIKYSNIGEYNISIMNYRTNEFYTAHYYSDKLEKLIFSDIDGIIIVEEYRKGQFYKGYNYRNAINYTTSQLEYIKKEIKMYLK